MRQCPEFLPCCARSTPLRSPTTTRSTPPRPKVSSKLPSKPTPAGTKGLKSLLTNNRDHFDAAAASRVADYLGIDVPPRPPKTTELHADHKVWTTTYWPYADFSGDGTGSKSSNLWAKGGCLEKFDSLLDKRGKPTGALAHEKKPALGWLNGSGEGYYIPSGTIRESDAERTTGLDFNGNGKIDANFAKDFLDDFGGFGRNGKTDGTMSVSWWGSCDKVAVAGQLFKEPQRSVTVDGVEFTPQDIKGLLTVIANSQSGRTEFAGNRYSDDPDVVRMADGSSMKGKITNYAINDFRSGSFTRNGDVVTRSGVDKDVKIKLASGETKTVAASDIASVTRESKHDPAPAKFHETVKSWLKDNRPFAMDHDSGDHVWNDSYDGAKITKSFETPSGVDTSSLNGANGAYGGGAITFYRAELMKGDSVSKTYAYWIEKDGSNDVNSGWLNQPGTDGNPDFMWRPSVAEPTFTGANPRNPYVLPSLVKEIYEKSI